MFSLIRLVIILNATEVQNDIWFHVLILHVGCDTSNRFFIGNIHRYTCVWNQPLVT